MSKERMPKKDYFQMRLVEARRLGLNDKIAYYERRLAEMNENGTDLVAWIDEQKSMLERSIVATPESREYLESFAKANQGSADLILMQMAVQFGYMTALEEVREQL